MSNNYLLRPSSTGRTMPDDSIGTVVLRDYQHAARLFLDSSYRLSPKYGFLFYVEFDLNPEITNITDRQAQELGMIVKSVNLPKFTVDTKIHNAYNRKNIVQNKISYDPVSITFHDDQADLVRSFWYDYYSFYYRDADYADSTYQVINKYQERATFDWGYTPRRSYSYTSSTKGYENYQYIQAIRIYSLHQKQFSEYELVNPTITSFKHGEHANGENSLLEHQMSIQFETVKYQTGYVTSNTVGGYIDLHYDQTPTPIAPSVGVDIVADPTSSGFVLSATDAVKDLATVGSTTIGPTAVGQFPAPIVTQLALNSAVAARGANALTVSRGVNVGAFLVPTTNFGQVTSGISNSTFIQQQLAYDKKLLVNAPVAGLVGGVVAGVTGKSLQQGVAIAGLIASAAKNPSSAIKTVENMAINYAMKNINAASAQLASQIATKIGTATMNATATAASDLNTSLGASVFGTSETFTQGISNTATNLVSDVKFFFTGPVVNPVNASGGTFNDVITTPNVT